VLGTKDHAGFLRSAGIAVSERAGAAHA
jgi:hypothetical protein